MTGVEDVWEYIGLLQQQSEKRRKKSSTHFSVREDIYQQLSFFTCTNHILDRGCQYDISKYIYCTDTHTPIYNGSYMEQPKVWLSKHFIIKQAIQLRESIYRKEIERQQ